MRSNLITRDASSQVKLSQAPFQTSLRLDDGREILIIYGVINQLSQSGGGMAWSSQLNNGLHETKRNKGVGMICDMLKI